MAYSLGFKSRSNLSYFIILATAASAFIAFYRKSAFIKSEYCNPLKEGGGAIECYWFMKPNSRHYWSIQIHLATCLPAMGLAITQFIPAIRQKYPIVHRWTGRVTMVLAPIATITGLSLSETAFGTTWSTISSCSVLAVMILIAYYKAWMAIRGRKIHKHRMWMIRAWAWLGSIVTVRPLLAIGLVLLTRYRSVFPSPLTSTMLCERLLYITALNTEAKMAAPINIFKEYANECLVPGLSASNISSLQHLFDVQMNNKTNVIPQALLDAIRPGATALVPAAFDSERLDTTVAMFDIVFGLSVWVGFIIHTVVAELYLKRTQAEHDRLKRVSDRLRKAQSKIE